MSKKIDKFWEIFKSVAGDPSADVIETTNAIAKSDRSKVESYFSSVIDQYSFSTADYNRLRKFFIDLYASHRAQSTIALSSTDPRVLTNSNLDELFRSMGYPLSSSLRGFDENPLQQKVNFFLDLVNLYKVKGTPQSLVDVLQYYGVTEVDIYEFFLKKDAPGSLFFDGKAVAGTTLNPQDIGIPYANIANSDPHWLYTASQILQLDQQNKINLPSKTPYLGVQPIVDLEGAEMAIIERYVQDQYEYYIDNGELPPPTAEITYIGETRSLLELYLSCIYMFIELFDAGSDLPGTPGYSQNFLCYNGLLTDPVQIIEEFDLLTKSKVTSRVQLNDRYEQYLDLFSRDLSTNFLVDKNTAGDVLNTIAPDIKAALDSAGEPYDVLFSLLKDLALWVRSNIGFGFVNFGFILFGVQEFFKDLKPVIDFFKPYRARMLLLESLQIRNRLFNTIVVEDKLEIDINTEIHDFITGNSTPCCNVDDSICLDFQTICRRVFVDSPIPYEWKDLWGHDILYHVNDAVSSGGLGKYYICIEEHESTTSNKPQSGVVWETYWKVLSTIECHDSTTIPTYYTRETFDCDSYFDIGAVTDIPREVEISVEEDIHDFLKCPHADTTGYVVSEILNISFLDTFNLPIPNGSSSIIVELPQYRPNLDYGIGLSIRFAPDIDPFAIPEQFAVLVTDKTQAKFEVSFSALIPNDSYILEWYTVDSTYSGSVSLIQDSTSIDIVLPFPCSTPDYVVSGTLTNYIDSSASIYGFSISDKTSSGFKVNFSGAIESINYKFDYFICSSDVEGVSPIPNTSNTITVNFTTPLSHSVYPLVTTLESNNGDIFVSSIIEKSGLGFKALLSGVTDATSNYNLTWAIPDKNVPRFTDFNYFQSGGFRDFDVEGSFDCTYSSDLVFITVEEMIAYLLQENGFKLLQENGGGILL
jgi:hypothetical protein